MHECHDIPDELKVLLCERLGVSSENLRPETSLEDVGIDSVELAFIFSYFERDTGLSFEDAEVDVSRYRTVRNIADLLTTKVAKRAQALSSGQRMPDSAHR